MQGRAPGTQPTVTSPTSAAKAPDRAPPEKIEAPPANALVDRARSRLNGGAALPPSTREKMERGFGRSFGDVRVHTDAAASEVAATHEAQALTIRDRIAFGAGQYRPGTPSGDHLIAHELAHVVQQSGSGGEVAQARDVRSVSSEAAEVQAEVAATNVVAGRSAGIAPVGLAITTRHRIMRRALRRASESPAVTQRRLPSPGEGQRGARALDRPSSPVLSSFVSQAGGEATAVAGRAGPRPEDAVKQPGGVAELQTQVQQPDEAQTPLAEGTPSPPAVMVAGAPAGAALTEDPLDPQGRSEDRRTDADKPGEGGLEGEKKDGDATREGGAAEGEGKGKKKQGKFGQNLGDRGAKKAAEAGKRLQKRAEALQTHEPAGKRIGGAGGAAAPPPNEGDSKSKGAKVGAVCAATPEAPSADEAKGVAKSAADAAKPQNMQQMVDGGATDGVRQQVTATVNAQIASVDGAISQVEDPGPAQPVDPAVPQPEAAPPPSSPSPALVDAAPEPVPEDSLDASEFPASADEALAEHEVDDEALNKAQDGPLVDMRGQKDAIDGKANRAKADARAQESQATETAKNELSKAEESAQGDMDTARATETGKVAGEEQGTKTGAETKRGSVADQIDGVYQGATKQVQAKLSGLTDQTATAFDTEQKQILTASEQATRSEIEAYKSKRYSGLRGAGRWLVDKFKGLNELPEVKVIEERNRKAYIQQIDALIGRLSQSVAQTIADCKQILCDAKTQIDALVENAPTEMKAEAEAAQKRAEGAFRMMEQKIATARAQATQMLKQKRAKAIRDFDQVLAKIRAENAGLLDKLIAFVQSIVASLGELFGLMVKIVKMGLGSFIGAASAQAQGGIKNHLWGALQEAFKQWVFSVIPGLEFLLNLPADWRERLAEAVTSLPQMVTKLLNDASVMAQIGVAAMTWLATSLVSKLIPGAGAVMAIIDGVRAAAGLLDSLVGGARAMLDFVKGVAKPMNAAASFARGLAQGIVAGLRAVLTFLGVDRLIQRVAGALLRPFGKMFKGLMASLKKRGAKRKERRDKRKKDRDSQRKREDERGTSKDDPNAHRARDNETKRRKKDDDDRDRRDRDRRRRAAARRKQDKDKKKKGDDRDDGKDRKKDDEKDDDDRKKRDRERWQKAKRELPGKLRSAVARGMPRGALQGRLATFRAVYRLSSLRLVGSGARLKVHGSINPGGDLASLLSDDGVKERLVRHLRTESDRVMKQALTQPGARSALASNTRGSPTNPAAPDGQSSLPFSQRQRNSLKGTEAERDAKIANRTSLSTTQDVNEVTFDQPTSMAEFMAVSREVIRVEDKPDLIQLNFGADPSQSATSFLQPKGPLDPERPGDPGEGMFQSVGFVPSDREGRITQKTPTYHALVRDRDPQDEQQLQGRGNPFRNSRRLLAGETVPASGATDAMQSRKAGGFLAIQAAEAGRSDAALAFAAFGEDIIEDDRGRSSKSMDDRSKEFFNTSDPQNPMARKAAGGAHTHELDKVLDSTEPGEAKFTDDNKAQIDREVALIKAWIEAIDATDEILGSDGDKEAKVKRLEGKITDRLERTLRV